MKKIKIDKIILSILSICLLVFIALNTYLIIRYDVLPLKYLAVYILLIIVIPLIICGFSILKKLKLTPKIIFGIIEIIYIVILIFAFKYLNSTFNFISDITSNYKYETKNYYVLVLKDSEYEEIKDLDNKKIGYNPSLDENVDLAIKNISKKIDFVKEEHVGYVEMFDALYKGNVDALMIIDSFYNILNEENSELDDKVKIIYKFTIKEKVNDIQKEVDVTKDTFNLYISGADGYEAITDKEKSDVNIIMNINPKTNKILMINIPRDYYVDLAGKNQKDKLTHAGLYGVETSVKTIENILDIDINYYVKVNYNALIKLVDALGGVDVYSSHNFTSGFGYKFKVGYNNCTGDKALEFVRTRKAFLSGDRVRGENQQAMIEAIIKKAASPSILLKYNDILESLKGTFATNISDDKIMNLVKMQLDDMPSWNIKSISLDGSDGNSDVTYSYKGQNLYVMIPKEETIEAAKKAIVENQ